MQRTRPVDRTAPQWRLATAPRVPSAAAERRTAATLAASAILAAAALLAACGAPPQPPGGGPISTASATDPVLITSPAHGAVVSGATYFAVQVLDPATLPSLTLRVAGQVVTPTFPGESPLRVFLIPRDHPEGRLQLSASVVHGGQTFTARSEVDVVHEPPPSATVAARGAVLGDVEANGAISTVTIPPGTAAGATVTFETLTQAEVLARTGVDYDALGVTFLGAQEVTSSVPTGDRVAMTSGGFGPMVQPGQVVVSYRITPDLGRGVGELMVINRAGTAPSGDIVSAPFVEPQVSAVEVVAAGAVSRAALAGRASTTLPGGPPGTQLRFVVGGLNPYAVHGYAARFRQGSQTIEVPAVVGSTGDGRQYLLANVPVLSVGNATVELYSVAAEAAFMTFTMPITAMPTVADPKALVDTAYAALLDDVDHAADAFSLQGFDLDVGALTAAVESARAFYASLGADDAALVTLARRLAGAGVTTSGANASRAAAVRPLSGAMCLLEATKYAFDRDFAAKAFQGDQFETGLRGLGASLTLDYLDTFADRLEGTPYDCDPLAEQLCEAGIGPGCGNDDEIVYPDDDQPNSPLPRPRPFPNPGGDGTLLTGMGSIFPPGGPLAGSGGGGGGGGGPSASTSRAGGVERSAVPRIEAGRYAVRVVLGGQPWPFASHIGTDGYFFVPALPDGLPVTIVVSDRTTLAECTFPLTGRSRSSASAVYVDLDACVPIDVGDYTIVWRGPLGTGGLWSQTQHWDPPRLPTADDDVLIPSVADLVAIQSTNVQVRSIRSLGTVRLFQSELHASDDLDVAALHVMSGASNVSAGGEITIGALRLSTPFPLPSAISSLKELAVVSGGRLTVDHTLTVTESLLINHGWLQGSGRTILAQGAAGELRGSPGQFGGGTIADTHTLEVRGTFSWSTEGGGLALNHDAVLEVAEQGTLLLSQHNGGLHTVVGSVSPLLVNHGLVLADAPGRPRIQVSFENHGTVEVTEGTELAFNHHAGRVDNHGVMTGEGTILSERFAGIVQPFVHHDGAVLDVATLRLFSTQDASTTLLQGTLGVRNLEMLNGRYVLDQDLALERYVVHDGATQGTIVVSSGAITVSDELLIGQGTLGGTGTTTLLAGGELGLLRDRTRVIADGHTLVNQGTGTWAPGTAGGVRLTIQSNAEFRNLGTLIVQNDRPVDGGGTFTNAGTVRKEIATGTSNWTAVCYEEQGAGQIVLDSGDISVDAGC